MKKIKLLTSLVGLTGLSMGLVPAIASCSCSASDLQVEFVSKKKEREFDKNTNSCSYTFKVNDISIAKNIKVKLINLKVGSSEAASVSGLIKSNYDSAGNIKVTLDIDTFRTQWPDATEFSFDLQFTNKINNEVVVITGFSLKGEEQVSAPSFEGLEWSIIAEKINQYYAGTITLDEFVKSFGNEDEEAFTKLEDFVGCERTFKINGVDHKFLIIDTDHDTLSTPITTPSGTITKALFTFESMNLLSDNHGDYLKIQYNSSNKKNYLEGELYKGLNDPSNDIDWLDTNGDTFTSKSIYVQLGLQLGTGIVKKVNKEVYVDEDANTVTKKQYSDYCFALSMTEYNSGTGEPEGEPYKYWTDSQNEYIRSNRYDINGNCHYQAWTLGDIHRCTSSDIWCIDLGGTFVSDSSPDQYNNIVFAFCI